MESLLEPVKNLTEYLNYVIFGIPLYKIVLASLVLLLSLFLRKFFILVVVRFIERLAKKSSTELDDLLISITSKPLSFLIIIVGLFVAFLILGMEHSIIAKLIKSLIIIVISWTLYNLVVGLSNYIYKFTEKFGEEIAKELGLKPVGGLNE